MPYCYMMSGRRFNVSLLRVGDRYPTHPLFIDIDDAKESLLVERSLLGPDRQIEVRHQEDQQTLRAAHESRSSILCGDCNVASEFPF